MDIPVNTTELDATVAIAAYQLYKDRKYQEALPVLLNILDIEPKNWQARLFVGACYFKMGQNHAAERALRFVFDGCPDAGLKQKACFALQTIKAAAHAKQVATAPEFDGFIQRTHNQAVSIERIIN